MPRGNCQSFLLVLPHFPCYEYAHEIIAQSGQIHCIPAPGDLERL
jgi:hypothetical protein